MLKLLIALGVLLAPALLVVVLVLGTIALVVLVVVVIVLLLVGIWRVMTRRRGKTEKKK